MILPSSPSKQRRCSQSVKLLYNLNTYEACVTGLGAHSKAESEIFNAFRLTVNFCSCNCSCKKVKAVIDGLDLDPSAVGILELDEMGQEGKEIQSYLEGETGQSTVPSVWIKKEFIGGEQAFHHAVYDVRRLFTAWKAPATLTRYLLRSSRRE